LSTPVGPRGDRPRGAGSGFLEKEAFSEKDSVIDAIVGVLMVLLRIFVLK
jgi:hypothetical protein